MAEKEQFKTAVGGQAVMEGVMMRGPRKWCLAVRKPDGEVVAEVHDVVTRPWAKLPFIRGIFNFVDNLVMGYKTLMRSAELALTEEEAEAETSKFDQWVDKKFGDGGTKFIMILSAILGVGLAVALFMLAPTAAVNLLDRFVPLGGFKTLLEGIIKIGIFVAYLAVVRCMKEMRRIFAYHGAEHKTVACYEAGDVLTVENVRKYTRFHPRCGTSFMLIVLIISILLATALPWPAIPGGTFIRAGLKILMLPLVMGISYEIIRLAGRYSNWLTRAISAPGMWLQRLTTEEPEDGMIEVAIDAITPVLPEVREDAVWGT